MTQKRFVWPVAASLIASTTLVGACFTGSVSAAEQEKTLSGSYAVNTDSHIEIEFGVGQLELIRGEGDTMEVTIIATVDDDSYWNDGDVSATELEATQDGDDVKLSVTEQDNVQYQWTVVLPRVGSYEFELGVGEIDGELWTADADIEVGVGDIDIRFHGNDVARVALEAGIGDTTVRGLDDVTSERAMVASETTGYGSGSAEITVEVGIGEARVEIDGR